MFKFINRNLGIQLLALYMLFVGPVLLAALTFDRFAAERLEADVKAADLALARAIAQETNTILDTALSAVTQLGTYPAVIEIDPTGMQTVFSILQSVRPDVNLVYRLDARGIMHYHYPTGPGSTIGWDFSFRDYYQGALNTRQPLLSKGRISPTTEQPVATAVMPLWSKGGQFLGLVATNITLQSLSNTLTSIVAETSPKGDFQVAIVDSAGQVIAHPDANMLLEDMNTNLPEITEAVLSGKTGDLIAKNVAGQERLYSYVPIPSASWGVIVSRSTEAAFATARATHRGILLTIGIYIVVGILFWLALSQRIIRPLQNLAAFSRTIGRDQPVTSEQRHFMVEL
ncbi:cache domain-containing protein, partial [Chloroflexota bacterium]